MFLIRVGRDWPLRLPDHHGKKAPEKEEGLSFPCEGYGVNRKLLGGRKRVMVVPSLMNRDLQTSEHPPEFPLILQLWGGLS